MEPDLISTEAAARLCGVSRRIIRKWFDYGWVKGHRRSPRAFVRIDRADIERLTCEGWATVGESTGLITTGQAARITGVSTQTVARWIDQGYLAGFRIPGSSHRRILRDDLVRLGGEIRIPLDWSQARRVVPVHREKSPKLRAKRTNQ
jgi:excisionase family DNA binding protein